MRGKWWVALLALIAFPVAMAILSTFMEKRYTAAMKLLVDSRQKGYDMTTSPFQIVDDVVASSGPRSVDTTVQMLTGTEVLVEAIQNTSAKYPQAFQGNKISDHFESLVRRLSVESSPLSDVILVRVTMDNPEIAAEVANQVGYAYINFTRKIESETGSAALTLIKSQYDETKKKLDEVDNQIEKIKDEYKITDQNAASSSLTQAVTLQQTKASELFGQLQGARMELEVAQRELRGLPLMISASNSTVPHPTLTDLKARVATYEAELVAQRARLMDDHPIILEIQARIKGLNAEIAKQEKTIRASENVALNPKRQQLEMAVVGAQTRIDSLQRQHAEAEAELSRLRTQMAAVPAAERKLSDLGRQRFVLESSFAQLKQRMDVIESTGSGRKNPARIVSTALVPTQPSFPDLRLFVLIGLAIGFVVAALIIMPKGDTDIYGNWPKGDAKSVGPRSKKSPSVAAQTDAPAIGGDPDSTVS